MMGNLILAAAMACAFAVGVYLDKWQIRTRRSDHDV